MFVGKGIQLLMLWPRELNIVPLSQFGWTPIQQILYLLYLIFSLDLLKLLVSFSKKKKKRFGCLLGLCRTLGYVVVSVFQFFCGVR